VTLLPHHLERLETTSAIASEVVSARGYRSVSSRDELKGCRFPRDIGRYLPGLVIPLYPFRPLGPGERAEPDGLLLRPDELYMFKDGHTAKYLAPAGQPNVLDLHPTARAWLLDAAVPLVLTEGTIKADAAVSVGLAAIGLGGVDGGWRNGAPLPEWELVPLKGRSVLVAFDSDVTRKPSVRGALDRLWGYLRRRGAQVEIVVLPPGPHGEKVGLDDFLAGHRGSPYPIGLLLEHAVAALDIPDAHDVPALPGLPEGLTGADVLQAVDDLLDRYIRFPRDAERWATTLWIGHTHFAEVWDICAYLVIYSAVMRSGKSHLLDLVRWLSARGRRMSAGSDAAVFRTLAQSPPPTLVFDEVDRFIGEHTDRNFLIGVLNEGFERGGVVARVEERGGAREVVEYPAYGPKAFTGIGSILPATTMDRAIRVRLERRTRSERIARWRTRRVQEQAVGVHELLQGWAAAAADRVAELYDSELEFTPGTNERAEDVWGGLLAVGEAAGGDWPRRARLTAVALTPGDTDAGELKIALLADIRRVFVDHERPVLKSGDLVKALNELDDAPWGGLRDGKGITPHRVARDLAAFELRPERQEDGGETVRGWWRSSLEPIWARYLTDLDGPDPEAVQGGSELDEPAVEASVSVGLSETLDLRLNQVENRADTSDLGNAATDRSVGAESLAHQGDPDTPTLSRPQGAEPHDLTTHVTVADEQLAVGFEGLEQTIQLGDGPPLEAHRLPPMPAAEERERFLAFLNAADQANQALAFDVETTGADPYAPGFAARVWSVSDGRAAWALDARDPRISTLLAATLEGWQHGLAMHNIQYDLPVAALTLPLDIAALMGTRAAGPLVDTMILARLAHPDARRIGLKEVAKLEFGAAAAAAEEQLKLAFRRVRGNVEAKWRSVDPGNPAYWGYAAADAALTARLHTRLHGDVDDELLHREMRVALICLRAGLRGWAVDPAAAAQLERDLTTERDRLDRALRRAGVASVTTTAGRAAIIEALRREGHPPDGRGLARDVLEPLALAGSNVAANVLALRTVSKFLALYVPLFTDAGERDGRLHAFPLTLATVTGRMSLPGVPLQTAPKGELELASENGTLSAAIRAGLVANPGHITASVDFATMELRIAAALSADVRLRQAVEQGDAHAAVAARLFSTTTPSTKQRKIAKTVNFAVLYGMGGEGLARRLRIPTDEAREFVTRWWNAFPAVRKLRDRLAGEERRSLWGRRLPGDDVPNHVALNHVIQAYGRDVFAAGLLALEDAGLDQHLLLPLHDEYVLALPAREAALLAGDIAALVATRLHNVNLPVEVTIGDRAWSTLPT
jgi:DNA polymerase I-like protein with 3'-5' exonuclease and polymerase domains